MLGNSSWFINNFEKRFNPIYYEDAVKFAEILLSQSLGEDFLLDEYTRFCRPRLWKESAASGKPMGHKAGEICGAGWNESKHSIHLGGRDQ